MKIKITLFLLVILVGAFLRFYQLNNIPMGIDIDEASQGYDAFSLLKTGKDRYGQAFPLFMRSFGNYQAPLYTYLTVIPVFILGLSTFSTRLVSAISGMIILICTFILIFHFAKVNKFRIAIFTTLFLGISPWAILFSRTAVEANLALALLVLGILLFTLCLKKRKWLFIIACFTLALSTYAYHAERIISVLFLGAFLGLFWKQLTSKKIVIIGIAAFIIIQIPHLVLINTPASKSRINQVKFWDQKFFQGNNGILKRLPFGDELFFSRKLLAQYTSYFSPKNLFFESDEQAIRSIPDVSVFFPWMIAPLLLGIYFFLKNIRNSVIKILSAVLLISPLAAAITREPFYTIRALPVFWVLTIIISFGLNQIWEKIKNIYIRYVLLICLTIFSLVYIYNCYFILLKYERMIDFGFYNFALIDKLDEYKVDKIIIDSSRMNIGMWYFFLKKIEPQKLQKELSHYVKNGYYSSLQFDDNYKIDNIEIRPIDFKTDTCKNKIIVGDSLSISEVQAREHKLTPLFKIVNLNNKLEFKGYSTDSNVSCLF